jgi:hypothetical protein
MKPSQPLSPWLPLAAVCLLGWMSIALWPRLLFTLGITDFGQWYLDSYAVLAAVDAVRMGVDPHGPNPLDPFLRNHKYSDWWFALRGFGLTREHNFIVGSSWVAAFALTAWLAVRPRNFWESGWLAVLLLSPPVLLGINRANNDLVIFALLGWCGVAAAGRLWRSQWVATGLLALATGLKFYPVVAALAFLWVRPVRRMPVALLLAVVVAGGVLISLWPQLRRGQFMVESAVHAMGAPMLGRELGWSDRTSQLACVFGLTLGAVGLVRSGLTAGLATRGEQRERLLAALGAIVVLACFAAGMSYSYRWIFALWMALWLWRRSTDPTMTPTGRWTARAGCALLFFCFWGDGGLCLVVNLVLPPLSQASIDGLQVPWRLWTQPLNWLLMMLFAGWLLEGALATAREWRASRSAG